MRESVGNTFIFNTIIIFVSILIALLVGSLSYSKAFKVKNRIVSIIEKHEEYNSSARNEIEAALASIGYRVNPNGTQSCPNREGASAINTTNSNYRYCVYLYDTGTYGKGRYYGVAAYMHFDVPIIGQFIEFPIYGETRIIYVI
jgi:hypothetical protein